MTSLKVTALWIFSALVMVAAVAAIPTVTETEFFGPKTPLEPWQNSRAKLSGFTPNPLDSYVYEKPDPTFKWVELPQYRVHFPSYTGFILNVTSQTWLGNDVCDCDHALWWHYMVVIVPTDLQVLDTAILWITGDDNRDPPQDPDKPDYLLASGLATQSRSVAASIMQVPNEPIYFENGTHRGYEDSYIAYTWKHFIDHPDQPYWLARCPMTAAGVRAMDTVTEFAAQYTHGRVNLTKWVVTGASKRGWTSWTVAAVDQRVIGVAPIVMDALNLVKNLHHFYRVLGGWTFAFHDYYNANITGLLDTPQMQMMADIVDPYAYRDRLTMPKYVVSTTGDEFFMPDDAWYYYTAMKGPLYFRMVPNAEHSLAGHELTVLFNLLSFYGSFIIPDAKLPSYTWSKDNSTGALTVVCDTKPSVVHKWWSETLPGDIRRDFRMLKLNQTSGKPELQGIVWVEEEVHPTSEDGLTYTATLETPKSGWRAFFMVLTFPGPYGEDSPPYKMTTPVSMLPDTLPFPPCYGEECHGSLL